ncbi:MAG: EF-P beta-lysylation protein EpmB [Colwellia sp.]|nr:EF-P beta-lysylation protein EpmB [Colwellia sp.]
MLPRTQAQQNSHTPTWKKELAAAITSACDLLERLDLHESPKAQRFMNNPHMPVLVPEPFLKRFEVGNANDPLLLQVLSQHVAPDEKRFFSQDPVGDLSANPAPGLLHKYQGRLLVVTTGACAVHCQYCFRQHFPYRESGSTFDLRQRTLQFLQQDTSIEEVILSGGDPLILNNDQLRLWIDCLTAVPQISTIRIHTRLPIVLPSRVDTGLLEALSSCDKKIVLVTHINHSNEMDDAVLHAMHKLGQCGLTLLNQSVLLKGVNDQTNCLVELSKALFQAGILPYYLHLLDPVTGTEPLDVKASRGSQLIEEMRQQLPGYLIPTLVRENAGAASKTPIT